MKLVFLTALGVGGATVIGSLIGFVFKKISHRFSVIQRVWTGILFSTDMS